MGTVRCTQQVQRIWIGPKAGRNLVSYLLGLWECGLIQISTQTTSFFFCCLWAGLSTTGQRKSVRRACLVYKPALASPCSFWYRGDPAVWFLGKLASWTVWEAFCSLLAESKFGSPALARQACRGERGKVKFAWKPNTPKGSCNRRRLV